MAGQIVDSDYEENKNPLQMLSMSSFASDDQDQARKNNVLQKQMIMIEEEARGLREKNSLLE